MRLLGTSAIDRVVVYNRCGRNGRRLKRFQVWVGTEAGQHTPPARLCGEADNKGQWGGTYTIECNGVAGDHVTVVQLGDSRILNLQEVQAFGTPVAVLSPPAPPAPFSTDGLVVLRPDDSISLAFGGVSTLTLPRGATVVSAVLRVAPHSGALGLLTVAIGAVLECDGQQALMSNAGAVKWEVQSYNMGFASDASPELASLLHDVLARRDAQAMAFDASCRVLLTLSSSGERGTRLFHGPKAIEANRPRLELIYEVPSTVEQLQWTSDEDCNVSVAVPTPFGANDTCTPVDSATNRAVADTHACPHLHLRVAAATSLTSAQMSINGLDLFSDVGFALNRLVVGRDGVCVAALGSGAAGSALPRGACFDTRTRGAGAEQLAAWIDDLPTGQTALIVSCSRFAFEHNLVQLRSAFASIGATNAPRHMDDAYALIGVKGAAAPLAEARTQCCSEAELNGADRLGLPLGPVCHVCDQTPAIAVANAACGARLDAAPSVLAAPAFGAFESESTVAAVSETISAPATGSPLAVVTSAASSGFGAIGALQQADVDALDAARSSNLASADGDRYGARLATDGDSSTYWLSVGVPDAVLTLDLGFESVVTGVQFEWEAPASSILVLYTSSATGDDMWELGASTHDASKPQTALALAVGGANAAVGVRARRLRLYLANATQGVGGDASLPIFGLREVVVTSCAVPKREVTASAMLAYRGALAPTVTSVYPTRGSTAGGTVLTLQVDGLPSNLEVADVAVSVVGLACAVRAVTAATVTCTTSSYGVTRAGRLGHGPVDLIVASLGRAVASSNATYQYIDLWSRYTTWGSSEGGKGGVTRPGIDTVGDSVWIQRGQHILLDADINVYMLIVQGTLEFDRRDLRVDASYIFVMGGYFIVGTEQEPFLNNLLIEMHGTPTSKEIPVYGSKTISCRACTLDLHGRPLLGGRTHVKLMQTAAAGASELWLTEPIDWDVGATIVVTSSAADGSMEEYDERSVRGVTDGGTRIILDSPLTYEHLGETITLPDGLSVDFRSNVALLSRNIVIQGGDLAILDEHGVHIMLHSRGEASIVDRSQGESLTARIENIEIRYAGQIGRLGRYPIHFHMIGAVRNSYVRGNSIHHTYNRAIAIHGVHYLRVQNNVAFETRGHTYFVEDGLESKCQITGNLAAVTRELPVGLSTDATPSSYWLVNGDNYVDSNIAAGSSHYGFWVRCCRTERGQPAACLRAPTLAFSDSRSCTVLSRVKSARRVRVRVRRQQRLSTGRAHHPLCEQRGA